MGQFFTGLHRRLVGQTGQTGPPKRPAGLVYHPNIRMRHRQFGSGPVFCRANGGVRLALVGIGSNLNRPLPGPCRRVA